MKVTDIEVHEIGLEYQDALAYEFSHYYHISGAHRLRRPYRYRAGRDWVKDIRPSRKRFWTATSGPTPSTGSETRPPSASVRQCMT